MSVPKKRLKCLCVCLHGNVRSVALAYLIKLIYKHEAIAIGRDESSLRTLKILLTWADKVIFLDNRLYTDFMKVAPTVTNVFLLDVGEDVWFDPYHHELQHKLLKDIESLNL